MKNNLILVGINNNPMSVLGQYTIHSPTQWVAKWPDDERDHSFSFDGEIKNVVNCISLTHKFLCRGS
jgi:hypothetical protein